MLGPQVVPAAFRERLESWDVDSPVVKLNAGLVRLPTFPAAGEVDPHRAMLTDHARPRRMPGGLRGVPARRAPNRVRRALLPDRLRPLGRAARAPHDERLRPLRALRALRRRLGRPPRRGRRSLILDAIARPRTRCARVRRVSPGARAARHREPDRAHRRSHLPGAGPAEPDVGSTARRTHPGRRPLSVWRGHPPRWLGDRAERPKRRDGRARGHGWRDPAREAASFALLDLERGPGRPEVDHPGWADPRFPRPSCSWMWPQSAGAGAWLSIALSTDSLPRCVSGAAHVDVAARRRVDGEHAPSGARVQHHARRLLGEVEAPLPRGHRDAGAEAEEGDIVDRAPTDRAARPPKSHPRHASRRASSVSLLPGTRTTGGSIRAQGVDRLLEAPRAPRRSRRRPIDHVAPRAALDQALRLGEVGVQVAEREQLHAG